MDTSNDNKGVEVQMKKGRLKYVYLIVAAILLTPTAVAGAREFRDGFYIGGEWLLIPLAILIGLLIDSSKDFFLAAKEVNDYDR